MLKSTAPRRFFPSVTNEVTRGVVKGIEPVQPARIIARRRDGLSTLMPLTGSCPVTSKSTESGAVGEIVVVESPNVQQSGGTGLGSRLDGGGTAYLEKQEPDIMLRGEIPAVTYFGGGFNVNFGIVYLLPSRLWPNPNEPRVQPIFITDLVIVSESRATANVHVSQAAIIDRNTVTGELGFMPITFVLTKQ